MLSLGEFAQTRLPDDVREPLVGDLVTAYRCDPDPGIHSAIDWLLRQRWGLADKLRQIDRMLAGQPASERGWYVNKEKQTLTILRGPVEFWMGTATVEPGQPLRDDVRHRRHIGRSFAIATKEVTVEQFLRFRRDHNYTKKYSPVPDGPIIGVTWFEAARYCRWLSEQEGIPEGQMCFPPVAEIKDGMKLPPDYLSRTGYRLPTEAEWEYACRAGAVTSRFYGATEELLDRYAWYYGNFKDRVWPVGRLKPNDYGLFDVYGNIIEWCQEQALPYPPGEEARVREDKEDLLKVTDLQDRVLRGGAFHNLGSNLRSAARNKYQPSLRTLNVGLRVARTYP